MCNSCSPSQNGPLVEISGSVEFMHCDNLCVLCYFSAVCGLLGATDLTPTRPHSGTCSRKAYLGVCKMLCSTEQIHIPRLPLHSLHKQRGMQKADSRKYFVSRSIRHKRLLKTPFLVSCLRTVKLRDSINFKTKIFR